MDTLGALDAFLRSAETGSFSGAARQLGLTPAAISKQVAQLERELGMRLFQRSTRSLALTEAGERLRTDAANSMETIRLALANASHGSDEVAGTLKVSTAPSFGRQYILPFMAPFVARYPRLSLDWHFDNRQVDLIREHFDAGIGGGIDLAGGQIARPLAPLHLILVASPDYLAQAPTLTAPDDLRTHQTIVWRSPQTGRLRSWQLRAGEETVQPDIQPRLMMSDPEAVCQSAVSGLGIALVGVPHALPYLDNGQLIRLLPDWYDDAGSVHIYYPGSRLLPAKTRHFIDFLLTTFQEHDLPRRMSALYCR
ncbi:MAG: LysR family transcriptional regulator [Burkholderiales bacterium]|nr:LysR family transcriptional regulator [Burkholderiales bacterium]